jgi:hypothetical protein
VVIAVATHVARAVLVDRATVVAAAVVAAAVAMVVVE